MPLLLAAGRTSRARALAGGPLDGALVRVAGTDALARSREAALDYAARARACIGAHPHRTSCETLTYAVVDARRMIRLGRIAYVNMAPVFFRLDAEVEEVVGVPTALNRQLSPASSTRADLVDRVRAERRSPRLLPRLCVSSEGAVESIQLVSKTPLEHVRTVAVTPESATSVVLTKVLLPDAAHVPLGEDAEAKLLIGDAALNSAFEDPTPHDDLGRLWLERTGLPMVFAVWAAPEPTHPELGELEDALVASLAPRAPSPSSLPSTRPSAEAIRRASSPPFFEKLAAASARASARPLHVPRVGAGRRRARRRPELRLVQAAAVTV